MYHVRMLIARWRPGRSRLFEPLLVRLRDRRFLMIDLALLALIPTVSLVLQIGHTSSVKSYLTALVVYTLLSVPVRLLAYAAAGLYNCHWRSGTLDDLRIVLSAWTVSTVLVGVSFYIVMAFRGGHYAMALPPSQPWLDGLLALAVIGGPRLGGRLVTNAPRYQNRTSGRRVLIVGAGNAGVRIVQDIFARTNLDLMPVGFLDDNPQLRGMKVCNLPVFGGREVLLDTVRDRAIDQVIIAIPSAPGKEIRSFLALCKEARVAARTLPSMTAIIEDKVSVNELRNVSIDDLLRREPIQTDTSAVRNLLIGKRVLVTGAGGSIGRELCRQVLRCSPSEIGLLGHGENSIFEINNELNQLQKDNVSRGTVFRPYIADIRDARRIQDVVAAFRPDIIFHAAAHKHVPLMEANPIEAVTNNVLGTNNVLRAAIMCDVERFVLISTDKAVNPTSVMGATKRTAELLVQEAAPQTGLAYVAVRFGNVLGSRGSVVPTFKSQIASGGPVTVSDPEMTRFFISIPEAVQLLVQAAVLGQGGEIFMLDMGSPIKIVELARDMIRLSGLGEDEIEIVFSGIRPGEKLYEELFIPGERYQRTCHDKLLIAASASSLRPGRLFEQLDRFEGMVLDGCADRHHVIRWLHDAVPEFMPDEFRHSGLSGTLADAKVQESSADTRDCVRMPEVQAIVHDNLVSAA